MKYAVNAAMANSPKSGYRTAAAGKPLQRRRNLSMIAMDLKAIR